MIRTISRQGVRDFIKRGETVMRELEEKLNLVAKFNELRKITPAVNEIKALNKRYSEVKDIDRLSDEILQVVKLIENEVEKGHTFTYEELTSLDL